MIREGAVGLTKEILGPRLRLGFNRMKYNNNLNVHFGETRGQAQV
jgi:hypothetical protein